MGKRTSYKKIERDFYPTPYEAVVPLFPHLPNNVQYEEPCCGNDDLIEHLKTHDCVCVKKGDISQGKDALLITKTNAEFFITNPPWSWQILNPLISQLSNITATWLLLNADLMHNKRMAPHILHCEKIVSVGRVSWMGNGKKGFENCAWFLFDSKHGAVERTTFYGR